MYLIHRPHKTSQSFLYTQISLISRLLTQKSTTFGPTAATHDTNKQKAKQRRKVAHISDSLRGEVQARPRSRRSLRHTHSPPPYQWQAASLSPSLSLSRSLSLFFSRASLVSPPRQESSQPAIATLFTREPLDLILPPTPVPTPVTFVQSEP